jgi:hypothetical protein
MRGGSSDRLYQQDMRKNTPGKKGPSTIPRTKRDKNRPAKLRVNAWHMDTTPQAAVTVPI